MQTTFLTENQIEAGFESFHDFCAFNTFVESLGFKFAVKLGMASDHIFFYTVNNGKIYVTRDMCFQACIKTWAETPEKLRSMLTGHLKDHSSTAIYDTVSDSLAGRVMYAAFYEINGFNFDRTYEACYEMNDGDDVRKAVDIYKEKHRKFKKYLLFSIANAKACVVAASK